MRSSFGSMGVGMMLSLVLIFLLMVAQLKSLVDPLLILATVPMGFIGVIWMLFLTNTTLNIQSMMGMIMLIGIVVSNTVILTDYANARLAAGVGPRLAIREAGATRLRPILMTAISAVMALLPSSLERRKRTTGARGDRRPAELDVPEPGVPARALRAGQGAQGCVVGFEERRFLSPSCAVDLGPPRPPSIVGPPWRFRVKHSVLAASTLRLSTPFARCRTHTPPPR